jgi:tetratricopeptide (TPR) repeat protein
VANSEDAALQNRLGISYQRMGDAQAARRAYRRAIDLQRDCADAWNNIGTLDHACRRYKRAISAYSKAIRLDPQSAVFYRNLGEAWLARGDVRKALKAWNEAYRLDPEVFDSEGIVVRAGAELARHYFLYAKLLAARRETGKALEYLSRAIGLGFELAPPATPDAAPGSARAASRGGREPSTRAGLPLPVRRRRPRT